MISEKKPYRKILGDWQLYALLLPLMIWFALWVYKPIGGLLIAFKNYEAIKGIGGSDFAGLANFQRLLFGADAPAFWRAFRNTFMISVYGLIFGFPLPIILAVFFSEIGKEGYRKVVQTLTYLPHFLSEVTITSIIIILLYVDQVQTGVLAKRAYKIFRLHRIY